MYVVVFAVQHFHKKILVLKYFIFEKMQEWLFIPRYKV